MKYTIKNFPEKRHYPKGACAPWMEDILDWSEGFEKELRAHYQQYKDLVKPPDEDPVWYALQYLEVLIEEVLGEDQCSNCKWYEADAFRCLIGAGVGCEFESRLSAPTANEVK